MTRTIWNVFRAARAERADVYHFHDPELIFVGMALRASGARVVFDVHEDIPCDILDKPWIAKPLRKPLSYVAMLALNCFERSFSAIVTATPQIAMRFSNSKTVVVANFPSADEMVHAGPMPFSQRPKTALYLGSITALRSIEEVVGAFASPEMGRDIRLILAGEFESPELYHTMRELPGWQRVDYLGRVPHGNVGELMNAARVGILSFRPAPSVEDALPTKLFEYMGAGLPVVISSTLRASALVEKNNCGIVIDPLNPLEIARAVTLLVEHPSLAQEMGERGLALVRERFQWPTEATKLLQLYEEIAR